MKKLISLVSVFALGFSLCSGQVIRCSLMFNNDRISDKLCYTCEIMNNSDSILCLLFSSDYLNENRCNDFSVSKSDSNLSIYTRLSENSNEHTFDIDTIAPDDTLYFSFNLTQEYRTYRKHLIMNYSYIPLCKAKKLESKRIFDHRSKIYKLIMNNQKTSKISIFE
jgi:hypothetical protein